MLAVVTIGALCGYSLGVGFDLFIEFSAYVIPAGALLGVASGLIGGVIVFLLIRMRLVMRSERPISIGILALGVLGVSASCLYGVGIGSISLIADC